MDVLTPMSEIRDQAPPGQEVRRVTDKTPEVCTKDTAFLGIWDMSEVNESEKKQSTLLP